MKRKASLKRRNLILKMLNLLGLILITIGSVVLALNTDKTIKVNTILMNHIQKAYGYVNMEPMSLKDKEEFIYVIKSAKKWNILGYCLFTTGFSLQMIFTVWDLKRVKK